MVSKSKSPERIPLKTKWSAETMKMIGYIAPNIDDKSFKPARFILKKRLEQADALYLALVNVIFNNLIKKEDYDRAVLAIRAVENDITN